MNTELVREMAYTIGQIAAVVVVPLVIMYMI